MGAAQMSQANKAQKRAQENLDKQAANSPLYRPSKEINDYYQEAKKKYASSPFSTPYYLETMKQADRSAIQALNALQTRGAAIGGASRINRILADTKNRTIANAMEEKNADLSRLGQAAEMQNRENQQEFDINKMTPYNRQLQLEQMRAQAAGERYNAGMQTLGAGLSNAASYGIASTYNDANQGFGRQTRLANKFNANNANIKRMINNVPKV